mmetsp:Transcript_147325/g.257432  ORF Transcript_147325/g.257432 Transcript_147325/m.257432 type:complete len:223 (-) Transcript_147325:1442-2110(-)
MGLVYMYLQEPHPSSRHCPGTPVTGAPLTATGLASTASAQTQRWRTPALITSCNVQDLAVTTYSAASQLLGKLTSEMVRVTALKHLVASQTAEQFQPDAWTKGMVTAAPHLSFNSRGFLGSTPTKSGRVWTPETYFRLPDPPVISNPGGSSTESWLPKAAGPLFGKATCRVTVPPSYPRFHVGETAAHRLAPAPATGMGCTMLGGLRLPRRLRPSESTTAEI